jgi:methyl-accepting chemotaxis protein
MNFRDWSVGRKLMVLMMAASSLALLVVCVVLLTYDVVTAKEATAEHLSALAQIIAENGKAALSFGDQAAASEVLATLKAEPHITAACIFDKQGRPFASYRSKAGNGNLPALRNPGTYQEPGRLLQYLPIALSGEQIGVVCIESDLKDLERRYRDYSAISLLVLLFSWLIALLVVRRMSRTITDPLKQLIGVARSISDSGDLEHEVDVNRKDELGDLARSFDGMMDYLREMAAVSEGIAGGNLSGKVEPRSERDILGKAFARMRKGLGELVRNVRQSATQVASGSNQVASASEDTAKVSIQASSAIDEVTSTMHEMSVNVQSVVRNTQMQAASVSQTSSSIDEMVASIQRVADTAKVLLDISSRSRDEVHSGIGIMEKTTDGLNRINGSIGSSSTIITNLGSRADNIGKIVEVIDDISEQTNLLALNAAIEAARAGEHGLGFAVVAEEVRKLAEKSANSTKEIGELIGGIQSEARKAVDNMEKSTLIVNEGLTLGNDLSVALRKISSVVTEVFKLAQEIGSATNEQSRGSSQIAKATTRLNEITHEITSSVEEQSGGAQAVVRAMERMREMAQRSTSSSTELAASAEQMSKMARVLLESMDSFSLDENGDEPQKLAGSRYALAGSGGGNGQRWRPQAHR